MRLLELQSLIGTLQFACKAVVPGRTFLQHMINLTRGVHSRFHHICLNKKFFKDLNMWKAFLAGRKGRLLLKKVLRGILRYQGHTCVLRQPVLQRVLLAIRLILLAWLGERDFSMIWAVIPSLSGQPAADVNHP